MVFDLDANDLKKCVTISRFFLSSFWSSSSSLMEDYFYINVIPNTAWDSYVKMMHNLNL